MTGPYICCNPLFGGKNELAGAPTEGNSTPAISYIPTPVFAQVLAPIPAFALGLPGRYTDKNLQRTTKLALELFIKSQKYGQLQASTAPRNHFFKAQNPNFYYKS